VEIQQYISDFRSKTGRLPSQVELSKNLSISPDRAIRALLENSTTKPKSVSHVETVRKDFTWILVAGLIGISAITFALSVYFTGLWFTSMFDLYIAGAISVAMVSYMVLSPQAAFFVKGFVKIPLWATFGIALVFSMGSTIAGQYNKLTEAVDVSEVNDRATVDLLRAEERDLLASIEVDRGQQAFHQRTLEQLSQTAEDRMENWQYINTERNMVNELGFEIEQKQNRISEIREELREELSRGSVGATEERVDFYSWLAGLLGLDRNTVEFWVSALPAVFIDIIAALSLNIAIGMRRVASSN
jgi:hypothetical protein